MSEEPHPEIVIVKRHARHAEEHHGGAWKIAFADFMTAMMALFLVLWLISSTSDKTKRAVAQYFNPVKLVDMTTLKKGFHDPKETEMGSGRMTDPAPPEKEAPEPKPRPAGTQPDKRRDEKSPPHPKAGKPHDDPGRDSGAETARSTGERIQPTVEAGTREPFSAFADPFATVPDDPTVAAEPDPAATASPPGRAGPAHTVARQAPRPEAGMTGPAHAFEAPQTDETRLEALAAEILGAIPQEVQKQAAPKLDIRRTDEGVLISLTDVVNDTMFSIGSAEPHRKTIEVLQRIARALATRPGGIVIRGHTDARPYRSGTSDNWRLSTARAHAARDILVREGLGEARIERVEGHADRSPKIATDPVAPENRRIEILLRKEHS